MDITLPKRIDGQQPVSLNGRQQITVVGANGSGKTRFVNRMIADLATVHSQFPLSKPCIR